jgi:hypothetical protein
MRRSSRVAAVLGATLALAGCVPVVPAPQPGFDSATAAVFEKEWMDNTWRRTELPDRLRPPDPVVRVITIENWGAEIVSCMAEAGYDTYSPNMLGYARSDPEPAGLGESVALYLCEASRQTSPVSAGVRNHAQLDYWYEYYRLELVPCLRGAGLELEEPPPSRSEFEATGGYWNPYLSLDPNVRVDAIVDGGILTSCSPNAPGLHRPWSFD